MGFIRKLFRLLGVVISRTHERRKRHVANRSYERQLQREEYLRERSRSLARREQDEQDEEDHDYYHRPRLRESIFVSAVKRRRR